MLGSPGRDTIEQSDRFVERIPCWRYTASLMLPSLVGRLLAGKYRVVRLLGEGGVALVYEAVYERIGRRVAVKVLKPEVARRKDVAERFVREARAASAVSHPGIVQVFDIGQLDTGEAYLVMEYLQGDSLAEELQKRKRLSQFEAIGVCVHILDALDTGHKAGVIHRDL
jgi:serine/threonine-protein kinase